MSNENNVSDVTVRFEELCNIDVWKDKPAAKLRELFVILSDLYMNDGFFNPSEPKKAVDVAEMDARLRVYAEAIQGEVKEKNPSTTVTIDSLQYLTFPRNLRTNELNLLAKALGAPDNWLDIPSSMPGPRDFREANKPRVGCVISSEKMPGLKVFLSTRNDRTTFLAFDLADPDMKQNLVDEVLPGYSSMD